jgi:hypothetical protein
MFPASDAALRAYLAFMSISCSPQSLRIYLSGLRQAHLDQGFEWVTASARHFVWKRYCEIKRMHGRPAKPKLAVTLSLLHEFARQILAKQTLGPPNAADMEYLGSYALLLRLVGGRSHSVLPLAA